MIMILKARFVRWLHLWRYMWNGDCGVTCYVGYRVVLIACTCGRVFWAKGGER